MPGKVALQGMQRPARQIHILGLLRLVESGQLPGQLGRMGGLNARLATSLEKGLQPLVTE